MLRDTAKKYKEEDDYEINDEDYRVESHQYVKKAFDQATEGIRPEIKFEPVAYLGTQVKNGTYYKVVGRAVPGVKGKAEFDLMTIFVNVKGQAEMTSMDGEQIDLSTEK